MPDIVTGKAKVGLISAPRPDNAKAPVPGTLQSQSTTSLSATRGLATFPIRVPSYTAGYQFLQAAVLKGSRQAVVMTFGGEKARAGFQLFQAPSSQYESGTAGSPTYFVVADNLTEVSLADAVAARSSLPTNQAGVANTSLVWERAGVLFHLIGHGLSDQELARIAASA